MGVGGWVCLCVCMSVCMSVCVYVCLCVCLSLSACVRACVRACLSAIHSLIVIPSVCFCFAIVILTYNIKYVYIGMPSLYGCLVCDIIKPNYIQ